MVKVISTSDVVGGFVPEASLQADGWFTSHTRTKRRRRKRLKSIIRRRVHTPPKPFSAGKEL